jgi:hypothetical protein
MPAMDAWIQGNEDRWKAAGFVHMLWRDCLSA